MFISNISNRMVLLLFPLFKEHAFESSQKYKEGKYIIELVHMVKDNGWDDQEFSNPQRKKKISKSWYVVIKSACKHSDFKQFSLGFYSLIYSFKTPKYKQISWMHKSVEQDDFFDLSSHLSKNNDQCRTFLLYIRPILFGWSATFDTKTNRRNSTRDEDLWRRIVLFFLIWKFRFHEHKAIFVSSFSWRFSSSLLYKYSIANNTFFFVYVVVFFVSFSFCLYRSNLPMCIYQILERCLHCIDWASAFLVSIDDLRFYRCLLFLLFLQPAWNISFSTNMKRKKQIDWVTRRRRPREKLSFMISEWEKKRTNHHFIIQCEPKEGTIDFVVSRQRSSAIRRQMREMWNHRFSRMIRDLSIKLYRWKKKSFERRSIKARRSFIAFRLILDRAWNHFSWHSPYQNDGCAVPIKSNQQLSINLT